MIKLYRFFLVAVAVLLAVQAQAKQPLELVGEARLQVLFWPIYESRLFNESGVYSPYARPVRLELTYLRDFKADALINRTAEEWDKMGIEHPSESEWLSELKTLWPDITENDELAIELDEKNRSTFYHNGEMIGGISDQAFGDLFLAIWLSSQTSQPDQRLALIGSQNQ